MLAESDKQTIREVSKKYHARRVLLFGSSLRPGREGRDIDIAVEGVPAKDFYRYCGELMFALSKPVDVVDLSDESRLVKLIEEEGVALYG